MKSPGYLILERWLEEANERRVDPAKVKTLWRAWDIVQGELHWTEQERYTVLAFLRTMKIQPNKAADMAVIINEIEAATPPKE